MRFADLFHGLGRATPVLVVLALAMRIVVPAGVMFAETPGGGRIDLGVLGVGDYIGGTSLTRQRMITGVVALADTMIVAVSREAMEQIVAQDHRLARQIGEAIEMRRRASREALAEAAQGVR